MYNRKLRILTTRWFIATFAMGLYTAKCTAQLSLFGDEAAESAPAGVPTSLDAQDLQAPGSPPPPVDTNDGLLYGNANARELVQMARQYDPLYSPPEQSHREQAVLLYQKAIEAQPGAPLNAMLANRIAQLYAFYGDPNKGMVPVFGEAEKWWKRCAKLTDSSQLLWAQAQMGLASTAVAQRTPESSQTYYDKILAVDPNSIQLENWKDRSELISAASPGGQRQELERLRQQLRDLQSRVREKSPYVQELKESKERVLQALASKPSWSSGRSLAIGMNAVIVFALVVVVARKRLKQLHN